MDERKLAIDEWMAWRREARVPHGAQLACDPALYETVKRLATECIGGDQDGSGALAIDADEFVHCLYVIVVTLIQVSKGDGAGVQAAFNEAATLLARDPLGWLKDAGIAHGIADLAVTAGMTAPLLLLARQAIVEGLAEWRRARETGKALDQALAKVDEEIAALQALAALLQPAGDDVSSGRAAARAGGGARTDPAAGSGQTLPKLTAIKQERRTALRFLRKQNDADTVIGASSFVSGSAIAAKCAVDTGTKAYYIIEQGGAAATAAAGAAGALGAMALGPIASAGSLALGGYMLHKSRNKRDAFRAEKNRTDCRVGAWLQQSPAQGAAMTSHDAASWDEHALRHRYAEFYRQKTQQHDAFFTHYTRWNKGFVAGSGLYTAGTVSKLALAGIVAAGGTALATPAAPVVLTAATGVAGAMMIFFSLQYLKGHGRLQRYQRYYHDDDPELDRHFLAAVDLLCADDRPLAGFDLRAAFYHQAAQREDQRQTFLADVAAQCSKRYDDSSTYTADAEDVLARRGPKPTRAQQLTQFARRTGEAAAGRIHAASAFARAAVHPKPVAGARGAVTGAWGNAREAARHAWHASRRHLTRTGLKAWLADPANHTQQARVLGQMIETQLAYLDRKLQTKLHAYSHIERGLRADTRMADARPEAGTPNNVAQPARPVSPADVTQLLRGLRDDLIDDERLYRHALVVCDALSTLANGPVDTPAGRQLLASTLDQFISVQQGVLPSPADALPDLEASHDRLATYLTKQAPARYRDLRGKLIETELQSTRIRDAWQQRAVGEPAGGVVPGPTRRRPRQAVRISMAG
ncbi:hypothetical protein KQH49_13620 [Mycetohabitans sp. B5]|uniref:Uncharacterized protein n=1 Tax=Mycetohabitans endofungorum TaxID=417203 RepID=A0A2P5KDE6_9BURK|nr:MULTISPECIES: hypothetical protein [Mycetohabitans]MCG1055909.1 hypothetical protein [Mycetohabitans sp. B5]PPB84727.1 hypothetical protein B0O95_102126 [Mycetohabitans endofungorum]